MALLILVATVVALIVMLTLTIAGAASFHGAMWPAVLCGGIVLAGIVGIAGTRKTTTTTTILDSKETE
ncbi:hypothetical protein MUN77_01460 [Leucobacter allii]|uniref:hypothetical protein n=1 Tax=Leucobacter allii TaxID=2932247 RepID=UPI001FD4210C|nr:hypothetical protein [Leucobacter allii]UOR02026.1 hypothetical protein MUN77_01460 [Leucobacter allii]